MSFKNLIGKLHLYTGMTTGLVVFIVAITGCLYCFKDEIELLLDDSPVIEIEEREMIPPSRARDIALGILPGRTIHGIAYGDRDEAIEVVFYEPDPEFYQILSLNPYSGELLKQEDVLSGFFHFILDGHIYLWMGEFGRQVVGYSTIIFLFILISGLILWYPKNRKAAGKRVRFQWNGKTRWKRKNYDLHNVLGFYASAVAMIIAITGLVMAFNWFQEGYYRAAGGDREHALFVHPEDTSSRDGAVVTGYEKPEGDEEAIDAVWRRLMKEYPDAYEVEVHIPHEEGYTIYAHMRFSGTTYWDSDYRYFDSRTLEEIESDSPYGKLEQASIADKLILMNYDIHVGAIGGLAGKIIVFLSALIVGSLPVTGFMIWWGRRKGNNGGGKPGSRSGSSSVTQPKNKMRQEEEETEDAEMAVPV